MSTFKSTTTIVTDMSIEKLQSSPVRRRIMHPTPLVIATRQLPSSDDSDGPSMTEIVTNPKLRSSNVKSPSSPTRANNIIYTSPEKRRVNGNVHHRSGHESPPQNGEINPKLSIDGSFDGMSRDSSMGSPVEDKLCNKYGFFVGSQEANIPESSFKSNDIDLIRNREKKWLYMLNHWDRFITKKWKKVRDRCRKGIPHSVRGRAWVHLCGAHHQMRAHPDAFRALADQRGNDHVIEDIKKDLHRQFPSHEMFARKNGTGQKDLYIVLKAFSILKPDIGYCQGMAPIASVLLMHMPAEDAFWSLVAICDHYLPGYFAPGLEAIQLHGDMLQALLKKYSPSAYKLMKKQKIEPILYMTEWFMCIFSRTLPWTSVLRVWDMFLCEGIKVVFKVAIEIITVQLHNADKECPSMYETLELLRHISNNKQLMDQILVDRVLKLDLHDRDLQREHNIQEQKRRKEKIKRNNR